jgi:hypothetical protein
VFRDDDLVERRGICVTRKIRGILGMMREETAEFIHCLQQSEEHASRSSRSSTCLPVSPHIHHPGKSSSSKKMLEAKAAVAKDRIVNELLGTMNAEGSHAGGGQGDRKGCQRK